MSTQATVFIIDDDEGMRQSLVALVESFGYDAESYGSAEAFLAADRRQQPGCVVTDLRMHGLSGLELQRELKSRDMHWPVILLTAFAEVPVAVQAMRAGAVMVLEKPVSPPQLNSAIDEAVACDLERRVKLGANRAVKQRLEELSPGERQVLDRILEGRPNKTIARALDVGLRTVEARRSRIFRKLGAKSLAELVRVVCEGDVPAAVH